MRTMSAVITHWGPGLIPLDPHVITVRYDTADRTTGHAPHLSVNRLMGNRRAPCKALPVQNATVQSVTQSKGYTLG